MTLWLKPIGAHPLIPDFIRFYYTENTGAAFGIMSGFRWFFVALTFLVIVGIVYLLVSGKIKNFWLQLSFTLVIAGGLGNQIDRIISGKVVDFFEFEFINFAIFNVADIYISIAAVMLALYIFYDFYKTRKLKKHEQQQ